MTQLTLHVTECRVYPYHGEDERLKAFASITLNDAFVVNVKVIQGNGGLFVAMPSLPRKDGLFHDLAHPITRELREHIEDVVLGTYHRELGQHGETRRSTEVMHRVRAQHQQSQSYAVGV